MSRRVLIFDLGGVLVDWSPRYALAPLIGDPELLEEFLHEVTGRSFLHEVDTGRPVADAVADRIRRFPQWADELRAYGPSWPRMVRGDIPGTAALLRQLAARGAPLYALSNWPAETFWVARERFAVLEVFTDIVVSGEVGLAKPDPRIYTLALERFGHPAEECVFVDDRADNVAAAAALGMEAVRFTDADALRAHPAVAAWLTHR